MRPLSDYLFPSHQRDWSPDQAVMPTVEFDGDRVRVRNIRNCFYESDQDYAVNYVDRRYDLRELESVDFIVVPFKDVPALAHTMLSFGFRDGEHLGVSVEARLERGEIYSPGRGALRQYELMYVVADERDLIGRRTRHRDVDVFLHRTIATPEQTQMLFKDVMERVNQLAAQPEFYDTLRNNCTTNIVRHINTMRPGAVPLDPRVLLAGASDRLAYELGLLDTKLPYEEARKQARITEIANASLARRDFSTAVRRTPR